MKKITLKIFTFTMVCFGLSFVFGKLSSKGQTESYWKFIGNSYSKNLNQNYQTRKIEKEIITRNARLVEIRAISTDVNFEKSSDDKIHIIYNDRVSNLNSKEIMNFVNQDENKVYIDLEKIFEQNNNVSFNMNSLFNFNIQIQDSKAIIQLPKQIESIDLRTVSGAAEVSALKLDSINFESVSGDLRIDKSEIKKVKQNSISGNIKLNGQIQSINSQTISGDLKLELKNLDPNLVFNTTSGDVLAEFEANPNIDVKFNSTSGEVIISEDLVASNSTGPKNHFKFGKGLASFNVETVSGDLEIEKVDK